MAQWLGRRHGDCPKLRLDTGESNALFDNLPLTPMMVMSKAIDFGEAALLVRLEFHRPETKRQNMSLHRHFMGGYPDPGKLTDTRRHVFK